MRDKNKPPEQADAEGDAEHWFAVIHSGAPTDQEMAAFAAWREADPDHARAYRRLEDAWRQAGDHADHPDIRKMRRQARQRPPSA